MKCNDKDITIVQVYCNGGLEYERSAGDFNNDMNDTTTVLEMDLSGAYDLNLKKQINGASND